MTRFSAVWDSTAPKTVRGDMRMKRLVWAVVVLVLLATGVGAQAELGTSHMASPRVTSTPTPSPRHSITVSGRSGTTRRKPLATHHSSRHTPTAGATDT